MEDKKLNIAFVCVENAGRSQIAESIAKIEINKRNLSDKIEVISGGTKPAEKIHTNVIDTLQDRNIDISDKKPQKITQETLQNFDYIITMGCSANDVCPINWNGETIDWDITDPRGKNKNKTKKITEEIEHKVIKLIEKIDKEIKN